ncbi:DnaJ C-terminal domain-containing protein [Aquisalinus flavus]|uniref:Molecular chaperone DnaJ n=1 Tax=Aquisalinus flavus TaxID=1526572 RepID=A0A8J2V589_9PROT|nr:J domain-containing protein [Aquisalinus flavus]MBD0426297.1 J domain-containing protein [Aquisalinus flavus]UNE48135.1 J domain-containing protein [Aquisalinus flavus]GGD09070.1 molecular chaperone DnaJ [Aquisalinus flavus]
MAKDPYTVLGVHKSADQDTIRKAYRALAKQHHPDRNPGDNSAEDKFKAASAAFEIIGDKDKRARYDRGEIDADGNERAFAGRSYGSGPGAGGDGFRAGAYGQPGGGQSRTYRSTGGGGFEDISDIFSEMFGGAAARGSASQQGRDVRYRMEVDFLEAARGNRKRVTMPDGRTLDINIPEGLRDGQSLRLRGQGEPGMNGGEPGDVYVDISVKPHRFFRLEGDTVTLEVPVTLSEAVLGGKITIPTVHGEVSIAVPRGASSGTALRLRGKGLKNAKTGTHGDQIARLRIVLPDKPDEALEEFARTWDGDREDDPRSRLKL